jgi:hypothetical protein
MPECSTLSSQNDIGTKVKVKICQQRRKKNPRRYASQNTQPDVVGKTDTMTPVNADNHIVPSREMLIEPDRSVIKPPGQAGSERADA